MANYGRNGKADRAILRALRGDEAVRAKAIERTHQLHGSAIYDRIRARFRSLSPDDVTEVWDDTLLQLLSRRAMDDWTAWDR